MRLLAALLLFASFANGEDMRDRDGKIYRNVKAGRPDPGGVWVQHSGGETHIKFRDMPEEWQRRYGWTEKMTAELEARKEATRQMIARYATPEPAVAPVALVEPGPFSIEKHPIAAFVIIAVATLVPYFLPTFIGAKKRNAKAIAVLNLFLGWTFVGWVVALVWACTKDPERP